MKVMIIDDSQLLRDRLRREIEVFPECEIVGEAASISTARELATKLKPDLFFLDIRLKDGVGIDMIEILKQLSSCPVVIVMTNYPYPQYRERCMNAGADYFLEKRNEFEKIPQILEALI